MFSVINKSKQFINLSKTITRNIFIDQKHALTKKLFKNVNTQKPTNQINIRRLCTIANEEPQPIEPEMPESAKGNEQLEHKFKVIVLETEVLRQEGKNVPIFLKPQHWDELLKLETRTARRKYLEFLFKIEKKKENEAFKKYEKRMDREHNRQPIIDDGSIRYDLGHNNIFLRFYDSTINNMYNNRLMQAMQFGQQLVLDCGYDNDMITRENVNCAKQLMLVFSENRAHDDPFDLHFCNANPKSTLMKALHRHIPSMYDNTFPLNVHENSYLDKFNKDQLVYLTPHCREEMQAYDHDAVYIVGGIVDKINNEPLSLAKAKKEGIRMLKLPLDKYLQWGSGSGKSLTLNQVVSIMLDVKLTGDWNYALKHVPKRKLTDFSNNGNNDRGFTQRNDSYNNKRSYDKSERKTGWKPAQKNQYEGQSRIDVRSLWNE